MDEYMDEHDITKSMLYTLREGISYVIKEEENDVMKLTGDELKEEQKRFAEMVGDERVSFTVFNIYPYDNNVVFGGEFDNGLKWQLSKKDGVYVSVDNVELTDDMVNIFTKLKAYHNGWSNEWASKLREEYSNNI